MKNNLTTMMAGAATVAAVTVGSAFMAAPAEALQLRKGDFLNAGGSVQVTNTIGDPSIYDVIFSNAETNIDPGLFPDSPFEDDFSVTFTNLIGAQVGTNVGPLDPFIAEIGLTDGSTVNFVLERGILFNAPAFNTSGIQNIRGRFVNASNDVLGIGNLSLQFTGLGGLPPAEGDVRTGSFSTSIEVIPTPAAVLPGLIGMGTAVFRKKKQEEEGDLALETAEAEA